MAVICCVWLNPLRLRQTDLWDHVNYGRAILSSGALPEVEPLLPLARQQPFINPAWGSQTLMAIVVDTAWLRLPAVQFIHAILVLVSITAVGWAVGRQSRSVLFAILAASSFLAVNWQQFLVVRPQTIGVCCFSCLFAALTFRLDRDRRIQVLIVLMFGVWANLHGSFPLGLFLIGVSGFGRVVDVSMGMRRLRNASARSEQIQLDQGSSGRRLTQHLDLVLRRSGFLRLSGLGVSCVLATLINPYGVALYKEILRVGRHANMSSMVEWRPLSLSMKQGQAAAWVMGAVLVAVFSSRRRLRAENFLLCFLLGILMLWSSRMINWWSPVICYLLGVHGASAFRRIAAMCSGSKTAPSVVFHSLGGLEVVGVLCAVLLVFMTSPLFLQLIGSRIPASQSVHKDTPVELGQFLSEHQLLANNPTLSSNVVFCPAEWTGYLMSVTRRTSRSDGMFRNTEFPLQPMVNTHVHIIPTQVWNDFLTLHQASSSNPELLQILDQYKIDVVILDRRRHGPLDKAISESGRFQTVFRDSQAMVWTRTSAGPLK